MCKKVTNSVSYGPFPQANEQRRGKTMKMKRFVQYLIIIGLVNALMSTGAIAQDNPAPGKSFKNCPDHNFIVKDYINGMEKGGHNLLIWKDSAVSLSQYRSVKVTEFGGRLLPQQNVFSYDPYIALFNSVFRSSLKLPQEESPDALLLEGAVVECNPGSRTARYLVGFGAGKAACAVVCEVYEPDNPNPCIRIYVRDTGSMGSFGGNSAAMLNHIMSQIATRLATTLNTTVTVKKEDVLQSKPPAAESETISSEKPVTPQAPAVTPSSTAAPATNIVTVTWTFANIRSGAGNDYSVVTTVKQGDKLTVIGELGEWFNVRLENGQEGWISNKVVK